MLARSTQLCGPGLDEMYWVVQRLIIALQKREDSVASHVGRHALRAGIGSQPM